TLLPPGTRFERWSDPDRLARQLGALGYPGFAYLGKRAKRCNPAEVLLGTLLQPNLEARLVEGSLWLLRRYPDMDPEWLIRTSCLHGIQNRLGFAASLARQAAETANELSRHDLERLASLQRALDERRLAREDTFCHDAMTEAERKWVKALRTPEAVHWNLLTDWRPEWQRSPR
ncbi:MAG: hypothetical protein ACRD3R_16825, partial [Terriglobales bacterium]